MTMIIRPADTATFLSTTFEVYDINGTRWLRGGEISHSLDIPTRTFKDLFKRHRSEFTPEMTGIITVPTAGGAQQTRIFSPRGAALVAMLAKTERAASFRAWVLDVLDSRAMPTQPAPTLPPDMVAVSALALKAIARAALAVNPRWRRILAYRERGFTNREIAKLLDVGPRWIGQSLRRMEALGLVEPPPDLPSLRARSFQARCLAVREVAHA